MEKAFRPHEYAVLRLFCQYERKSDLSEKESDEGVNEREPKRRVAELGAY